MSPAEFQKYAPVGGRLMAGIGDLAATIGMAALSGGTTAAARLTTGAIMAPMAAGAAVTAKNEGLAKGAAELNPLKAFWDPHADWEDKTLAVLQTAMSALGRARLSPVLAGAGQGAAIAAAGATALAFGAAVMAAAPASSQSQWVPSSKGPPL